MADSPAHDSTRTVSYVSDPIGRAFGLAIVVGVASVPLIAITIAIVHLGDVRGMWGLLLFGVLLLVAVMVLYWMERRYSSEGIDLRKIGALENIELARVDGDTSVQLVHARAVLRDA